MLLLLTLLITPSMIHAQDITGLGGTLSAQYQTGSPPGEEYTNLTDNNVNTSTSHLMPRPGSSTMQIQAIL